MEKVNPYSFYDMASDLARVRALPDNVKAVDALWPILGARGRITALLERADPVPVGVCKASAVALYNSLTDLWSSFTVDDGNGGKTFAYPKDDTEFPGWKLNLYRNSLEKFETVFSAEMSETATYFVPRKGIFFTPALVDSAEETFPKELRDVIPDKTRDEWRSAGRCLAFNLLSASGFHVARAVEGTMESYYLAFCGQHTKQKTWGDYLKDLEPASERVGGPSSKTLSEIAQMKDDYRNPLMHPRVVLSESDARMLFANGESLIIAMAAEIKAKQ